MYAIIKTGGKQHKVQEGDIVHIEKLAEEIGNQVEFKEVFLVGNGADIKVGAPTLANAKVTAEVVDQFRGDKIKIIKFRRRKHSMKRQGHRQYLTAVKITKIES
ncbi:MAG: 50S ribosomal protein L21 [Gammaproteobacteria bacterium RIFCSPHIGHO2_12_FULL_41_15]|nr:MAG: 50S ribosomal protein L21 [Gammaproteobacteria bacterium RIFCSPHIGHO2_12_FULL_41_15]